MPVERKITCRTEVPICASISLQACLFQPCLQVLMHTVLHQIIEKLSYPLEAAHKWKPPQQSFPSLPDKLQRLRHKVLNDALLKDDSTFFKCFLQNCVIPAILPADGLFVLFIFFLYTDFAEAFFLMEVHIFATKFLHYT